MRELVQSFLREELSRRAFAEKVIGLGFTAAAAQSFLSELDAAEPPVAGSPGSTVVKDTGGDTVTRLPNWQATLSRSEMQPPDAPDYQNI